MRIEAAWLDLFSILTIHCHYFSPVSKSSVNHQMKLRFINEIEVGFIAAMNQTAIELKTTAFH